jgi:hypothetical protein
MTNWLVGVAQSYQGSFGHHGLTFLCNTDGEVESLRAHGLSCVAVNHNCLVDDFRYRPLPGVEPEYDAVYNACIAEYKRHNLAVEIERLAFIFYRNPASQLNFRAEVARLQSKMPAARFVNELTPDGCRWLSGEEVNEVMARSRVGLCLSAEEGAMRASVEYLFAGLSVVSTPSVGGRERYFDDEYCIIADPDPRSIRDAVQALVARSVPREFIRARTLAKVERDRARYIDLVQAEIDRGGGKVQFAQVFRQRTRETTVMHFRSQSDFRDAVNREILGR